MYPFREFPLSQESRQIFHGGSRNPRYTPVMYEQALFSLLADPFDSCQCRFDLALAAQTPVESDSESVSLIPYLL